MGRDPFSNTSTDGESHLREEEMNGFHPSIPPQSWPRCSDFTAHQGCPPDLLQALMMPIINAHPIGSERVRVQMPKLLKVAVAGPESTMHIQWENYSLVFYYPQQKSCVS